MAYIQEAFDTNWISPFGNNVDAFEKELEDLLDIPYATLTTSATAALHLAMVVLNVMPGDLVLVPTLTFAGCVNPVVYQGATPVFVDSEPETWNINPSLLREAIENCIKKGKKPKALIMVHIYGVPAKVTEILSICSEFEIPIVEDAADALGSSYSGKKLGTFGTIGVISFNGNKIITTSGGGVFVSNQKEFVERAAFLGNQAKDDAPHYQHSTIGYNYRMSNVLAGIGRGQLEVLADRVKSRRRVFEFYQQALKNIPGFSSQAELLNGFANRWLSAFKFDEGLASKMIAALSEKNIECRPIWKPMHMQPVFSSSPGYIDGTAERIFNTGLCLPSGSLLPVNDQEMICEIIYKVVNQTKSTQIPI